MASDGRLMLSEIYSIAAGVGNVFSVLAVEAGTFPRISEPKLTATGCAVGLSGMMMSTLSSLFNGGGVLLSPPSPGGFTTITSPSPSPLGGGKIPTSTSGGGTTTAAVTVGAGVIGRRNSVGEYVPGIKRGGIP